MKTDREPISFNKTRVSHVNYFFFLPLLFSPFEWQPCFERLRENYGCSWRRIQVSQGLCLRRNAKTRKKTFKSCFSCPFQAQSDTRHKGFNGGDGCLISSDGCTAQVISLKSDLRQIYISRGRHCSAGSLFLRNLKVPCSAKVFDFSLHQSTD